MPNRSAGKQALPPVLRQEVYVYQSFHGIRQDQPDRMLLAVPGLWKCGLCRQNPPAGGRGRPRVGPGGTGNPALDADGHSGDSPDSLKGRSGNRGRRKLYVPQPTRPSIHLRGPFTSSGICHTSGGQSFPAAVGPAAGPGGISFPKAAGRCPDGGSAGSETARTSGLRAV